MDLRGLRKAMKIITGEFSHIPGCRPLPFGGKSVWIFEGTACHSQLVGFLVHFFYKGINIAANIFRQGNRSIISRDDGHTLDQFIQPDLAVRINKHP